MTHHPSSLLVTSDTLSNDSLVILVRLDGLAGGVYGARASPAVRIFLADQGLRQPALGECRVLRRLFLLGGPSGIIDGDIWGLLNLGTEGRTAVF